MADAALKSHPPILLLANSYNFGDLLKASNEAHAIKDDAKRADAVSNLVRDQALLQAVIEDADKVALPLGHKHAMVEDAQGRQVLAAVPMSVQDMKDYDAEQAKIAAEHGAEPPKPIADQIAESSAPPAAAGKGSGNTDA